MIVHAAVAFTSSKISSFVNHVGVLWTAPIIASVGTVLIVLGYVLVPWDAPANRVLSVVGAVLSGVGSALMVLMWGELYARLSPKRAFVFTSFSFILLAVVHFCSVSFPPAVATVVAIALPFASLLCMLRSRTLVPLSSKVPDDSGGVLAKRALVLPIVSIVVLGSCCELLHALSLQSFPNGTSPLMGVLYTFGGLCGTVLLLSVFFFSGKKLYYIARAVFVCMAVGLVVSAILGLPFVVVYAVFSGAFWCFRTIAWTYGVVVVRGFKASPLLVFAAVMCAFDFSIVIGILYGSTIAKAIYAAYLDWTLTVLVVVVCILLVALMLFSESQARNFWYMEKGRNAAGTTNSPESACGEGAVVAFAPERDETAQNPAVGDGSMQPRAVESDIAGALREEFGLTNREVEVCLLLLQGRSLPYIQKELSIARGTANTHLRHIYEKVGVHTRQELIDAVKASEIGASASRGS